MTTGGFSSARKPLTANNTAQNLSRLSGGLLAMNLIQTYPPPPDLPSSTSTRGIGLSQPTVSQTLWYGRNHQFVAPRYLAAAAFWKLRVAGGAQFSRPPTFVGLTERGGPAGPIIQSERNVLDTEPRCSSISVPPANATTTEPLP
jgi:hypothetical protein